MKPAASAASTTTLLERVFAVLDAIAVLSLEDPLTLAKVVPFSTPGCLGLHVGCRSMWGTVARRHNPGSGAAEGFNRHGCFCIVGDAGGSDANDQTRHGVSPIASGDHIPKEGWAAIAGHTRTWPGAPWRRDPFTSPGLGGCLLEANGQAWASSWPGRNDRASGSISNATRLGTPSAPWLNRKQIPSA